MTLAVAAVLRLTHLTWGLPSLLEEAMPLRIALRMIDPATGRVSLDPHFFNYPSFSIYLHLLGAQIVHGIGHALGHYPTAADFLLSFDLDPSPLVIMGRLLHAAAGTAAVLAVYRIARRFSPAAGWIAVLLATFSPVMLQTERTIIVDTIEAALLAWSFERMIAWHSSERMRDLCASAVLLGLATSTKYPAIVCLLPMLAVVLSARPARFAPRAAVVIVVVVVAFLGTSPYLLLDSRAALRDIVFEQRHAAAGHLGSQGQASLMFHLSNLARTLGPAGIMALACAPLLMLDRARRMRVLPLVLGFVLLVVPIVIVRYDAERYLAPALPVACVLAAAALAAAIERVPAEWRRMAHVAAGLLAVAPVAWAGIPVASNGIDDTQRLVRRWCERNVPADALIIEEGWSAPLISVMKKAEASAGPAYRHAGARARAAFDGLPAYRVVSLPVRVTGTIAMPAGAGAASVASIDLNQSYYHPALYSGADYIITSAAVRGRYAADPARFARQAAFYALLDRHAALVARFEPGPRISGPDIRVYRATAALRAEFRRAPLPVTWWASGWCPPDAPVAHPSPDGPTTTWRRAVFTDYFAGFAGDLAIWTLLRGDTLASERLLASASAVDPSDAATAVPYSICLSARGAWQDAHRVLDAAQPVSPDEEKLLRLQRSRVAASRPGAAEGVRARRRSSPVAGIAPE